MLGGRVSDKYLTEESGFLRLFVPGDTVLADGGFDIAGDIGLHGGELAIPAFTRGKSQLTQEVEFSQTLAQVRIHVEQLSDWTNEEQIHATSRETTN